MLQRSFVTPKEMRIEKKIGSNPTAKTVYKGFKTRKNEVVRLQDYPDLDSLNKHFAPIGSRR